MSKPLHTRTFRSGNSVAVRLPSALAIPPGMEVELERAGDLVTLRLRDNAAQEKARFLSALDQLKCLAKPPAVQQREAIDFPDRSLTI